MDVKMSMAGRKVRIYLNNFCFSAPYSIVINTINFELLCIKI
jgi:hypothetical protein